MYSNSIDKHKHNGAVERVFLFCHLLWEIFEVIIIDPLLGERKTRDAAQDDQRGKAGMRGNVQLNKYAHITYGSFFILFVFL